MITVGFVGSSGTGKSYRAQGVAKSKSIDYIIDDGLLIADNRILAGISAKKEATKLQSVRRALFQEADHCAMVRRAIEQRQPDKILILGTSLKMVERIAAALGLPALSEVIYIEDVASPADIAKAKEIRTTQGMHVIPVPTFEIKKDFSGYFIDSVKDFLFRRGKETVHVGERSVVRPTFNYLGEFTISDKVLTTIACEEARKVKHLKRIYKATAKSDQSGAAISVEIGVCYGYFIPTIAKEAERCIRQSVENITGMNVNTVTIVVKRLIFPEE